MTYFLSTGYDDPENPTFHIDWKTGKTHHVNPATREKTYCDNYYERDKINRRESEILLPFANGNFANGVDTGPKDIIEGW